MDKLITFFKVCSDETRFKILMALYQQSFCVCELCELLDESQPKVSKHLSKMKDLGLVKTLRKDKYIYYSLSMEEPFSEMVFKAISERGHHYPEIQALMDRIHSIDKNPLVCKTG